MDTAALTRLDHCPAPAKLNLFLHVIGRRADGYHLLQSAFRLLDWHDLLSFSIREDGAVHRITDLAGVPEEADITVRAARHLQRYTGTPLGADISIIKQLPMGGGLGGGSSDAATTLIALNRLWGTGLTRSELTDIGLSIGADVPFFLFGQDAFVEGVGEQLAPFPLAPAHYVVIWPGCEVPTAQIFSSAQLTRNTEPIRITDFALRATRNDLQTVACEIFPEIGASVDWLSQFAPARMTGSGACVFAEVSDVATAAEIVQRCPPQWKAWSIKSLASHPLSSWLKD